MPELGALQPYGLRGETGYDPRAFNYGPAPRIEPVTTGASAILGSAASLKAVSDTLSKLPALVTESYKKGQLQTEQNIAHQLKLGALAGGLTDSMKIGADDSVTLNPEDPETAALKQDALRATTAWRNAMSKKAGATPAADPDFVDAPANPTQSPTGALSRPITPGVVDGGGNIGNTNPNAGNGPLVPPSDFSAPQMPPGALSGGASDIASTPQRWTQGALAAAAAPQNAVAPPVAAPAPALAAPQPTPTVLPPLPDNDPGNATLQGLVKVPAVRGSGMPTEWKDPASGAVFYRKFEGQKFPQKVAAAPRPSQTDAEAANKAAAVTTARELALRGHTPEQIAAMTDAEKQTALAVPKTAQKIPAAIETEMIESGYNPRGKDAKDAIEDFTQARIASGTIPKYLLGPTQRVMTQAENSKQVKDYSIAMGAQSAIHAATQGEQNGFTDMALIEGVQRTLNPGATVRVGTIQQMKDAVGWLATKDPTFLWNQAVQGDKLTPEARQRAIKVAQDAFEQLKKEATPRLNEMRDTLKTYGVSDKSAQALLDSQLKGLGLTPPAPAKPANAIHVKFPDGRTGWVPSEDAFNKAAAEYPGLIKF